MAWLNQRSPPPDSAPARTTANSGWLPSDVSFVQEPGDDRWQLPHSRSSTSDRFTAAPRCSTWQVTHPTTGAAIAARRSPEVPKTWAALVSRAETAGSWQRSHRTSSTLWDGRWHWTQSVVAIEWGLEVGPGAIAVRSGRFGP